LHKDCTPSHEFRLRNGELVLRGERGYGLVRVSDRTLKIFQDLILRLECIVGREGGRPFAELRLQEKLRLLGPQPRAVAPQRNGPEMKLGATESLVKRLSGYGLGRFPVTLYKEQWIRLLAMADEENIGQPPCKWVAPFAQCPNPAESQDPALTWFSGNSQFSTGVDRPDDRR
jgi:hypothetical protein